MELEEKKENLSNNEENKPKEVNRKDIPIKKKMLSYSRVIWHNTNNLNLNMVKNYLVFLSLKIHKYYFCGYLDIIDDSNTRNDNFFNILNLKSNSSKNSYYRLIDSLAISPLTTLKNHNLVNKIKKNNEVHLTFSKTADKFLEEDDYKKLSSLFLKEEKVYKADEEEAETKRYKVKSKKKIVAERILYQVKQISKFDEDCDFKSFCEWSVTDILPKENEYKYEDLIPKLEDLQVNLFDEHE